MFIDAAYRYYVLKLYAVVDDHCTIYSHIVFYHHGDSCCSFVSYTNFNYT